jgi:hypothetical protein
LDDRPDHLLHDVALDLVLVDDRIVLGGDYSRPEVYNHLDPQWRPAQYSSATIGFRLVHVLP